VTRRLPFFAACVLAVLALLPSTAQAQFRRGPRVSVGATIVFGRPYRAYAYSPLYPYGYWYPDPYYYGPRYYYYDDTASIRMEVTPRQTEVYVDGYYAGIVDDFDGTFQRLNLEPGEHDVTLFLPGHRPYNQRIYLQPRSTFRIRQTMERLAPGEPEPIRPTGAPSQGVAAGPAPRAQAPRGRGPIDRGPAGRGPVDQYPDDRGPVNQGRGPGAQSDYGTVAIRVQPADADVLIDGERWDGPSGEERLLVQLAPGTHRIEVRKTGYRGYMTDISVRPGETAPLNVALASER
jgi:hypothetical protein